jgi:Transposase DDE domain group 1
LKVMGRSTVRTVDVAADGTGLCSRAGTALLPLVAARLGLVDGVCAALAGTRERRSAHDPGRVFCDLAVMLADGGRCVSDVAALAGQPSLFGQVASVSTARRVLLSIGENELDGVRQARARARERAWAAGAAPDRVILDFDATPISVHSEKELAAGHYKGGFGFNPLLASCAREVLAGVLRPPNAGANNAKDHLNVLELALEQLPESALDGEILARSDSAGASHDFAAGCRECRIRFSLGYAINQAVRGQILALPESAWTPAVNQDGQPRDGAWVAELTGLVNLDSWPEGTRLICRRERPHPWGAAHVHRRRRASLPVLHHRPARPGHRRARGDPPPARRSRGSRQDTQGLRRWAPTVPPLPGERGLARAGSTRSRHPRLDTTATPRRRARHQRTQAAALPHPARRRTNHPPRPTHHTAPPSRLALVRRDPPRVQAPAHTPRLRLTAQPALAADSQHQAEHPALAATQNTAKTTRTSATRPPHTPPPLATTTITNDLTQKPPAVHPDDESRLGGICETRYLALESYI